MKISFFYNLSFTNKKLNKTLKQDLKCFKTRFIQQQYKRNLTTKNLFKNYMKT